MCSPRAVSGACNRGVEPAIFAGKVPRQTRDFSPFVEACRLLGGRDMTTEPARPSRAVILVATDGSAASNEALTAAARFAMLPGSEAHVVHVLDAREVSENPRAVEDAQSMLAATARAHGLGADAVYHVEAGVAWQEIVALGARLQADVIVVGTHDRGAVGRMLLGSVAEQVVKHARCPVFVARKKDHGMTPEIEPPCEQCLAVRRATSDADQWCERHRGARPHARLHYETAPGFGGGSQLIRP